MSLLIALGGAARRGSQMIREAQEEERKKAELKELRAYQREQLQEQREYQKGLLQEEREYQSEVRAEDRLFRESQAEKNRAFQASQAAIARKTAAQVRAEANAMALAQAGILSVDYNNPEEVAQFVQKNKLEEKARANAAKIAKENREADLESAQKFVEAGAKVGKFFTATEFLKMDDKERARIGKLIGNADPTFLPADQYGPTRIKSLSMYDDKNADRAAYMYFTTENWGGLAARYALASNEQKRNTLLEIKQRASQAELYNRSNQRDDSGNIVSDAKNLVEIYGDVLEGTPFYDVVREAVLGAPAPRDEVTGELLLPGGGSAQVSPAATAPAKAANMSSEDFIYGLIQQSPDLTVTNIEGETQVPLQYYNAIESIYALPGIAEAIQNPRVSIFNAISDFKPGQKKQLAFVLNAGSKNPNSALEAIDLLAAADQNYVPKTRKKIKQLLEPLARKLLSTELMQNRIKKNGGDIYAAAEATVTDEKTLQKELRDFKDASSIGVGTMREGAMLIRGLRGQVNQAFSNDKTALDYLEAERKAIIDEYMKAYDPEESELDRAEYRKAIEEELMVGTSYAEMDEKLVMDGIYRLLRERLAYSLVKTLDPSGRISDRDRESGLSQLGTAGFTDVQSAAAAADYLLADSDDRLLRARPFVGRLKNSTIVYDEKNLRLADATVTYFDHLKGFNTRDYRQPYDPVIHNYVTLDDGRMYMADSDGLALFPESGGIELVRNPKMGNKIVRKDSLRGMYDPNKSNTAAPPAPTTTDVPESASMFKSGIRASDLGLEGGALMVMINSDTGRFFVDNVDVTDQIPPQERIKIIKATTRNN